MGIVIQHSIDWGGSEDNLRTLPMRARGVLADVLDEGARIAEQTIEIHAPHGRSGQLHRHIESRPSSRSETGALEAVAGIRMMPKEKDPKRGVYPEEGTGIFGRLGQPIRAKRPGGYMVFSVGGRQFRRKEVKGQRPQRFVRDAYEDLIVYLPQRLELMVRQLGTK